MSLFSNKTCSLSGFLHSECFNKLEQIIIRYLTSKQFARTNPSANEKTIKKYTWQTENDRSHLWRGGHLLHFFGKDVKCRYLVPYLCSAPLYPQVWGAAPEGPPVAAQGHVAQEEEGRRGED